MWARFKHFHQCFHLHPPLADSLSDLLENDSTRQRNTKKKKTEFKTRQARGEGHTITRSVFQSFSDVSFVKIIPVTVQGESVVAGEPTGGHP
jgi:hypothetical protein